MITTLEMYKEQLVEVEKSLKFYQEKLKEMKNDDFMNGTDVYNIYVSTLADKMNFKHFLENQIEKMENKAPGRPSQGITKKVSITIPQKCWNFIDEKSDNKSSYFRALVLSDMLVDEDEILSCQDPYRS